MLRCRPTIVAALLMVPTIANDGTEAINSEACSDSSSDSHRYHQNRDRLLKASPFHQRPGCAGNAAFILANKFGIVEA